MNIVPGATGGIGRAIVEELAERDVRILAGMRDPGEFRPVDDMSKIQGIAPGEWAERIVAAIENDDELLNATGAERLAKLASRGPAGVLDAVLARAFDR